MCASVRTCVHACVCVCQGWVGADWQRCIAVCDPLRYAHELANSTGQSIDRFAMFPCCILVHAQAVQLLDSRSAAPLAAGLLYQLSMDDAAKSMFAFCPGALARLYESIMRALGAAPSGLAGDDGPDRGFAGFAGVPAAAGSVGDLRSVPELIALAVNLAHSKRTAEVSMPAWHGRCVGVMQSTAKEQMQSPQYEHIKKNSLSMVIGFLPCSGSAPVSVWSGC